MLAGLFCREVDYLDYMTTQDYDFDMSASSNNNTILEAMSGSGETWSPSAENVISNKPIWMSYTLLMDEDKGYVATINDIKFSIAGALSVKAEYTFREIPSQPNIPIGESEPIVGDTVIVDVSAVSQEIGFSVSHVRVVFEPALVEQLTVYNMDVRVCYFPKS